ncbi:hypothetical protein IHE44_0003911 [Lamprotornis superbus]|uniref:Uncharacterized protein n=1 Tax=Lamprotornis superbus TaxID=245042 RepID=A0A835TXR6_9PASS|nr:hypothetical protein IHE44_0003911 [Lamprotornis superbus]
MRPLLQVVAGLLLAAAARGRTMEPVHASLWWVQEKDVSPGTKDQLPHIPPVLAIHWAGDTLVPSRLLHVALGLPWYRCAGRQVDSTLHVHTLLPSGGWAPLPAWALPGTTRL